MNHQGTKKLETKRLILRKFTLEDAEEMYNNWASEDEVTRYLPWPTHENPEFTKGLLADWIQQYEKPDFYNWVIELKETGEIVGNISVVQIKEYILCAEIGYCMGSKWWGNGIMPEAGKAVIKYLFEEIGFNRIQAQHQVNNQKSGKAMQKMGMTYEGTRRQAGWSKQGITDIVEYGILKEDYDGK